MSFKSSLKSLFWSGILVAALALLVGCTPGAPVTTETTGVTPTEAGVCHRPKLWESRRLKPWVSHPKFR
jgi:hypothetical protein